MAEISHFLVYFRINKYANRGNCCIFLTAKRKGPPATPATPYRTGT